MKLLRIPKLPKFKMPRIRRPQPQKLEARTSAGTADGYADEEPQTKLTSAFIVVLILHVVLVGGIYAFNQIKTSRHDATPPVIEPAPAKPAATKPAKPAPIAHTAAPKAEKSATAPAALQATPLAKPKPAEPAEVKAAARTYTVKSGDRLIFIAKKHGVTPEDIVAFNALKSPDKLQVGQVLKIPAKK